MITDWRSSPSFFPKASDSGSTSCSVARRRRHGRAVPRAASRARGLREAGRDQADPAAARARPATSSMFLDEARLAATLTHPNIAQVYDVGVDGDALLRDGVRRTAGPARICRRARAAGGHGAGCRSTTRSRSPRRRRRACTTRTSRPRPDGKPLGIVHRDVSPSNVLVSYDGAVKLSTSASRRARSAPRRSGPLKGKVAYMSPEQCRGVALDRRSDVFSLGTCCTS